MHVPIKANIQKTKLIVMPELLNCAATPSYSELFYLMEKHHSYVLNLIRKSVWTTTSRCCSIAQIKIQFN